jgi:hypothetical protein
VVVFMLPPESAVTGSDVTSIMSTFRFR